MAVYCSVRRRALVALFVVLCLAVAACAEDDSAVTDDVEDDPDVEEPDDVAEDEEEEVDDEAPADIEPATLDAISFLPVDHDLTEPLHDWVAAVEDATDGQVTVEWDRGPETIPDMDQYEAVQAGVVDVNFHVTARIEDQAPDLRAFSLSEQTPWEERDSGFYDLAVDRFEELGLRYLGRWLSEQPFYLWVPERPESPEDLEGLRMRTSVLYDRFMEAQGMTPVTVDPAEVFTALESGLVDGFGWPILGALDLGWTDHVDYVIDHPFFNQNAVIVMNLDVWEGLDPAAQDTLLEVTEEFERDMAEHFATESEAERERLEEAGIEFVEFSGEQGEEYTQLALDIEWDWIEQEAPDRVDAWRDVATE